MTPHSVILPDFFVNILPTVAFRTPHGNPHNSCQWHNISVGCIWRHFHKYKGWSQLMLGHNCVL